MKVRRHYSERFIAIKDRVRRFTAYMSDSRDIETIRKSEFFDASWYRATYPDVAAAGVDPAKHYFYNGAGEGRNPSEKFNSSWYRAAYLGAREHSQNPLLHYVRFGMRKGNTILPPTPWWKDVDDDAKWSEPAFVEGKFDLAFVHARPVAIIVPVFNAAKELRDCLLSLVEKTPQPCRFIIINDASTDSKVEEVLREFSETPGFEIYRNDVNCGFTKTVNRGLSLAGGCDVVLLNSDTIVTPGWLRNIKNAAYSSANVGTVTPVSDNAGAFSVPEMGRHNSIPSGLSADTYARAITQVSRRTYPRVPTGNGFCMYIRNDCLMQVGILDAEAFPRGYGEENDFCMRAGRLGWEHIIDDATLIYHVRSASFGDEKTELMKQGRAIIEQRYPEYSEKIRAFTHSESLVKARQRIALIPSMLAAHKGSLVRPRVLYVLSTQTGGTPQTNQDLMSAIEDDVEAYVLRCNSVRLSLSHFGNGVYTEVAAHLLKRRVQPFPHRSDEYDYVVAAWLLRYSIELVHVRHIAWHSLGLVDVSKNLNIPVVFSFHDFYPVCPTVNLLDDNTQFCGAQCSVSSSTCTSPLWPEDDFSDLRDSKVYTWRKQLQSVLSRCDAFVTTSKSTKTLYLSVFPFLAHRPFHVIPHGRDFVEFDDRAAELKDGEPLRVLLPGNLNAPKGGEIISTLARLSPGRFELHILGNVAKKIGLSASQNVVIHGPYRREEFVDHVRRIRPHLGAVLSICPETYCHTLTELWSCGIPVVGFDIGAVGERLRETRAGWALQERSAFSIFSFFQQLKDNPSEITSKIKEVRAWQEAIAKSGTCDDMGKSYLDVYANAAGRSLVNEQRQVDEGAETSPDRHNGFTGLGSDGEGTMKLKQSDSYKKKRLVLIPSLRGDNVPAGSGYVRLLIPYMSKAVTDTWEVAVNVSASLPRPGSADVAVVQRGDSSTFSTAHLKEWEAAWHSAGGKIVYDIDDDLMDTAGLAVRGVAGNPQAIIDRVLFLADHADVVTVSTPTLYEKFSGSNPRLRQVANNIQFDLWQAPAIRPRVNNGISSGVLRIGYMGTATHDDDLAIIRDAVLLVKDKYKEGVSVEVVGAFQHKKPPFGERVPLPLHTDYVNFVLWAQQALNWDVGVIPLTYDSFNNSKSDLKFLEYAAMRLAIVCSDAFAYKAIARHEENCLVAANTTEAWYKALCKVVEDHALRSRIADTAYREVLQERSINDVSSLYLGVLDSVSQS